MLDLTNAAWLGKAALAHPQFGTTSTHFHALRASWGDEAWLAWCRALAANKPRLLDGNSVVVQWTARGEAVVGLTDSDDIAAGLREGAPVTALPLTPEMMLIPNTVGFVRNAPHPVEARELFDYLTSPEVAQALVDARALEGSSMENAPPSLQVDWERVLQNLEETTRLLNGIFQR
jgi:iron(III) transport system substrate-binding protein